MSMGGKTLYEMVVATMFTLIVDDAVREKPQVLEQHAVTRMRYSVQIWTLTPRQHTQLGRLARRHCYVVPWCATTDGLESWRLAHRGTRDPP